MERNRSNFRPPNSDRFSQRFRNDSRKHWQPQFNSNNSCNFNPWISNPLQNTAHRPYNAVLNTMGQRGSSQINNGNNGQWNQNRNVWGQSWPNNTQDNDGGYWKQISGNQNEQSSSFERGNFTRERRTPYDRPRGEFFKNRNDRYDAHDRWKGPSNTEEESSDDIVPEPLSPLEAKIEKLISEVQGQADKIGELILLQNNNELPPVLINNAVHQVKNCVMNIDRDEATGFSKLKINNTVICEGMYSSKKDAKEALYEMALDILKMKCFFISSKSHYEEVSMDDINNKKTEISENNTVDSNSVAMKMMLKMGWGGKGLGTKEQGEQKSVADKIVENISREGLGGGGKSVMQEIDKILADYAKSTKTITLAFDSGFTKEERARIHSIAAKYHLKSKSEGGFNSRRITISKKCSKWVLIRELLRAGLENESYILSIPDEFQHLWISDEK
ncbi:NF-kappa-B-repressing factor-like [Diabrotica undecimpunctata]|uniref:NF-kappa-B-repressing factor-like n=1 Tax=Diabrotica undecimpunctata TaxID=50387 RepID=UPI003B63C98A